MFKMIDLFAGIGGIRIAFEKNGVECVMSSEIDKYAAITYEKNFKEKPKGDIKLISSDSIPSFDILAGGFPCQPFSLAGLRKGFNDARGTLFFEVARILKECHPKAFLLENVEGLVNHDNKRTISVIENTLTDLGYNFKWKVMNACEYGVPQNRKRWYCVGFRNDLGIGFSNQQDNYNYIYNFPKEKKLDFTVKDILSNKVDDCYKVSSICEKNIRKYYDSFENSGRIKKGEVVLANEIRASRCNFRADGISPCLTAKMGTGGNNIPVIVKKMRKLTEKECLKLMGFPSGYIIEKNSMHSYKQIGNSVVVTIIELLAKEMIDVLNKREIQYGSN